MIKIAVLVCRLLLGLVFVVCGINILFPFLPAGTMLPSDATTFTMILVQHKYMAFVGVIQLVSGILLLVGRYVPLALTMLGPVIVNILLFHFLLEGGTGVFPGLLTLLLEVFLIVVYRRSFLGLFAAAPEPSCP
jgi:putative oxidoreductase